MPDGDEKVPNPEYQELERVRRRVVDRAAVIAAALDRPVQGMGSGQVWTGPVADRLGQEVAGRKHRLAQLSRALVDGVDARLRSTPQQCPRDQAVAYLRSRRILA